MIPNFAVFLSDEDIETFLWRHKNIGRELKYMLLF